MRLETRRGTGAAARFDVRADNNSATLEGYAAVFGEEADIGGDFTEVVQAGAFADSLREHPDVPAVHSHDMGRPLARVSAGSLELHEDSIGLRFKMHVDRRTRDGEDIYHLVRSGVIFQMSFSFSTLDDDWFARQGDVLRVLKAVRLYEISPVVLPAYTGTSIQTARAIGTTGVHRHTPADADRRVEQIKRELLLSGIN